jgi:glycosyl transferase family 2
MSEVSVENETAASMPLGRLTTARVAILMCTKNGAAFIDDQLHSIANQTHENWMLIVSDDHSNDATVTKLKAFAAARSQKVIIRKGPGNPCPEEAVSTKDGLFFIAIASNSASLGCCWRHECRAGLLFD